MTELEGNWIFSHYITVGCILTLIKNPKHTESVLTCGWLSKDNVSLREVDNVKSFYSIIVFFKDTGLRGVLSVLHISIVNKIIQSSSI